MDPFVRVSGSEIYVWNDRKGERSTVSLSPEDQEFLNSIQRLDDSRYAVDLFGRYVKPMLEGLLLAVFKAGLEKGRIEGDQYKPSK